MKTLIIVVIIIGSALLCLQVSGRRLVLEEEGSKEKADTQLMPDAQPARKLDGVKNGATDTKPNGNTERSGTDGPLLPTTDDNKEKKINTANNNNKKEVENGSFGDFGVSGSGSDCDSRFFPDYPYLPDYPYPRHHYDPYPHHHYGNNHHHNNKEHEKNDCYGSPYESAIDSTRHFDPDYRRPPH